MAKVFGRKRHTQRLRNMRTRVASEAGRGIFVGAGIIQAEARRLIAAGAVQGAGHVPSAPGEPPNWDTGTLAGAIEARKTGLVTAETSSNAPYALFLEKGTRRMAERPYMVPATRNSRAKITALVRRLARAAIRGAR